MDLSRDAYVADSIAVLDELQIGPATVIGQSMGGVHALLLAARRPDLVGSWPPRFTSLAEVRVFFGGNSPFAEAMLEVLEERPEGYVPQFSIESMLRAVAPLAAQDYWAEWDQIRCRTLVVGGALSSMRHEELREMASRIPQGQYTSIRDAAGHRAAGEELVHRPRSRATLHRQR